MSFIQAPRRNLIIAGAPRSGKSILSGRLSRALPASHIPIDALISSFYDALPNMDISHSFEDLDRVCDRFRPFLEAFIRHLEYEAIRFVLDVWHLRPRDAVAIAPTSKYQVLYLGYPSASVEQKCERIRESARPNDWTEEMDEGSLRELVTNYIAYSKTIQKECEELGLRFLDTGRDFSDCLDRAFAELVKLVQE